ncbi:MAG: hypothetical protein COA38_20840 [Fluviicola sp.]|nr:MAG: hypothetical protein COA38_20840 [Fluviicola sp.]
MDKSRIYRSIFRVSIAMFIFGTLHRIMHWPFGVEVSICALILISISSVLYFSSKLEKTFIDELAIVGIPLWALFNILRITHAPYQSEIRIGILIIVFIYSVYRSIRWYRKEKSSGEIRFNLGRSSYVLGASLIVIGLLFKYLHWPSASIILLSGVGLMLLNFFLSMFSKNKDN